MKSKSEIEARVRGLLVAELDRRVVEVQKRLPRGCINNHRQPLDARKTVDGEPNEGYNRITNGHSLPVLQTIGLCMLGADNPEDWAGTVCEDPLDAQRCPDFTPLHDKATLLQEYMEQLASPEWVEGNMPDVCGLTWALDQAVVLKLPWWKRLAYWFLRIRTEPVVTTDLEELLEAALAETPQLSEATDDPSISS